MPWPLPLELAILRAMSDTVVLAWISLFPTWLKSQKRDGCGGLRTGLLGESWEKPKSNSGHFPADMIPKGYHRYLINY